MNRVPTDILQLFDNKDLVKICAPMVRYSKLQFRTLVRQYGCDLCFTPMILADSFCQSDKARKNEFTSNLNDSPLITQFAANTVHDFVGASYMVSPYCDGVDLNCGCPQRWAKQMGIGCTMLEKPDLVTDLISQCRNQICKPFTVSVKLRILKDIRKTVELCRRLEKAGVSFLSIHARNPTQHTGDINVEALRLITENVNCPVIGNGAVNSLNDCKVLQEETKCKGVMVANGLLTNPTLFTGSECTTEECVQSWLNICYNSTLNDGFYQGTINSDSDNNEVVISEKPLNLTFQCFHHHLVFMLEKILPKSKRKLFNNLKTFKMVLEFLYEHFGIVAQFYNVEEFVKFKVSDLNYQSKKYLYNSLKLNYDENNLLLNSTYSNYDYESDGIFFKTKLSNDIHRDNYGLSSMFS